MYAYIMLWGELYRNVWYLWLNFVFHVTSFVICDPEVWTSFIDIQTLYDFNKEGSYNDII